MRACPWIWQKEPGTFPRRRPSRKAWAPCLGPLRTSGPPCGGSCGCWMMENAFSPWCIPPRGGWFSSHCLKVRIFRSAWPRAMWNCKKKQGVECPAAGPCPGSPCCLSSRSWRGPRRPRLQAPPWFPSPRIDLEDRNAYSQDGFDVTCTGTALALPQTETAGSHSQTAGILSKGG